MVDLMRIRTFSMAARFRFVAGSASLLQGVVHCLVPRGARARTSCDSQFAAELALDVSHATRNIALSNACLSLVLKAMSETFLSLHHHVYCHARKVGNECADMAVCFLALEVTSLISIALRAGLVTNPSYHPCSKEHILCCDL